MTQGRPALTSIRTTAGFEEADLLRLAAAVERASEHPLAAAEGFESRTGRGVLGRADGRAVDVGTLALMEEFGASPDTDLRTAADELRGQGQTVMFVAVDGRSAGLVGVADPVKETTPEALRALREEGLRLVMLTGDNRRTAEAVAARLGIDEVIAEVLHDAKADTVCLVE